MIASASDRAPARMQELPDVPNAHKVSWVSELPAPKVGWPRDMELTANVKLSGESQVLAASSTQMPWKGTVPLGHVSVQMPPERKPVVQDKQSLAEGPWHELHTELQLRQVLEAESP